MPNHGLLDAFSWDMSDGIVTKVPYGRPAQGFQQRGVLSFLTEFERVRDASSYLRVTSFG